MCKIIKIIRNAFLHIFGCKPYYYVVDDDGNTMDQCVVYDTGVGSKWCSEKCKYLHRHEPDQKMIKCPAINKWRRKNKKYYLPL
jgi:glyoxylase-like metal-dependent hydrolase (beta-lactamase superfamily II)